MANRYRVKAKKSKEVVISNEYRIDPKTPIPLETNGTGISIKGDVEYIPFLDSRDNFFQVLLESNINSPTNNACVNSKTKFSIGNGFFLAQENTQFNEWAKRVNNNNESLNDVLRSIFFSEYTAGNTFIEVVRTTIGRTKFVKCYVRQFTDCRLVMDEYGKETDTPTHIVISKEFRGVGTWNFGKNEVSKIPIYNGEKDQLWAVDKNGDEHIAIFIKESVAGYDYYGLPSNIGGLRLQMSESKMIQYNNDNFDNNLVIGGAVFLGAGLSQEEADKVSKAVVKMHAGDGNRGRFMFVSNVEEADKVKVVPFEQNKDYDFIQGSANVESRLIFANEWSKALIDPQAGGLGNSGKQIKEIYEVKVNTVIKPKQKEIIDKFISPLFEICNDSMNANFDIEGCYFDILPAIGVAQELDLTKILTRNEQREILGFPPIEETLKTEGGDV